MPISIQGNSQYILSKKQTTRGKHFYFIPKHSCVYNISVPGKPKVIKQAKFHAPTWY